MFNHFKKLKFDKNTKNENNKKKKSIKFCY